MTPHVLFRNSRQWRDTPLSHGCSLASSVLVAFALCSRGCSARTRCAAAFSAQWRSAVVMSLLLLVLFLWDCSSSRVPAMSAPSMGEAVSTLLLLTHGQWRGGKQACQGHWSVLIYSWSQIALTSLARKPILEAMAVFTGQWNFRRGALPLRWDWSVNLWHRFVFVSFKGTRCSEWFALA